MPKFPKAFARRKSTANAFEDMADAPPVEPSFKVFERPDRAGKSFDGGVKFAKSSTVPAARSRASQLEDDNMFENLGNNRGSAASNTNTTPSVDSSRMSASSTTPSSTDNPGREDWRSPHDKPYGDIPIPPVPKSNSTFSLKNAGRTLSWGRKSHPTTPIVPKDNSKDLPSIPVDEEERQGGRSRAVTASSYASTATPPKLDDRDLGLSLGGDFSEMFAGFGKRKSTVLDLDSRAHSQSPDILPSGPANRNRLNQPSPLNLDRAKGQVEESPYSWSSQNSHDRLMSNNSTPAFAPRHDGPPPVPQHGVTGASGGSPILNRSEKPGALPDTGLRRSSANGPKRQSTFEYGNAIDEDARLLRESVNASRGMHDRGYNTKVRDSWALPSDTPYKVDDSAISGWNAGSVETTPRAKKPEPKANGNPNEDNLFDYNIAAAANIAERFQEKSLSPPRRLNKVMTPQQFERYKKEQERLGSVGAKEQDDEDGDEDEPYDDDEDEAEKNKQLAKQRRKQEAHMAVYRQKMMKVTGEAAPSVAPPRPGVLVTQSSPNLLEVNKAEEDEEDEEVPLAILQAHGFPNKNRLPMKSMGSNPSLRASSAMGGADSRLPVFARNLPQDPYLGAGLQNPMHRESLAFGGGAGSVAGAPVRALPPGGLVGVIATEERSRAMRRGSPNAQGEYGPPTPGGMNGMSMPPNMSGNMYNGIGPGAMPPMPPMMMTPGDQAQIQMSQQMQQFMQMQMQFMQMMTSGQGPQQNGMMPQQGETPRPSSSHNLRPGSAHQTHQRAMTMMDPNSAPWMQQGDLFGQKHFQGGYTPSIAPSERSNIGLPGRYRPVSHAPPQDNKSRTSTMSSALQGWDNAKSTSTIRQVKKSGNVSDEDEELGWEEMAKKKLEKKNRWKSKRDTTGLKDILNFTQ